jgi:hypothetical protein
VPGESLEESVANRAAHQGDLSIRCREALADPLEEAGHGRKGGKSLLAQHLQFAGHDAQG